MASPLQSWFEANPSVEFVRYQFVDLMGILRGRVLTKSYVLDLEKEGKNVCVGPGMPYSTFPNPSPNPRASVTQMIPDWSSLRKCCYRNSHASVFCYLHEEVDDMGNRRDPRLLLANAIKRGQDKHGIDFLIGFELEFTLLKSCDDAFRVIRNAPGASIMAGLRCEALPLLELIARQLLSAGITVRQFHTEESGQFEIAVAPLQPLEAVDTLLYATETVKTLCEENRFKASFFPDCGNAPTGQHVHLSINDVGKEDSFLAGILQQLPSICAIAMPNFDSYTRVKDCIFATGSWISWGTEIRDAPIRKIKPGHWEIRCVDGTANMYLTLAAILEAGLSGIQDSAALTIRDCRKSAAKMDEVERKEMGITERLPGSLKEALDCLGRDKLIKSSLGADLVEKYLSLKELEESVQSSVSQEERQRTSIQFW